MANGNLFGSFDPRMTELALQQEQQRNMIAQANMDPAAYLRYSAGLRGQMIGQGVANLFGTGRIDPRLQQASDAQAAYQEALSIAGDSTSPAFFRAFANAAAKRNIPTLAQQAATQAAELESTMAQTFQRSAAGTASMAQATKEDKITPLDAARQSILTLGARDPNTLSQTERNELSAATTLLRLNAPGTTVNVGNKESSVAAGRAIGEAQAAIDNKFSALTSLKNAKKLLEAGIYAGPYAPLEKGLAKYSGGIIGSKQKVVNTERFLSEIGNTVIPRLQEFGGNDSVEELKYLRDVQGGRIDLEPETLRGIIESAETKIQAGIERLKAQSDAIEKGERLPLGPMPSEQQPRSKSKTGKTVKRRTASGIEYEIVEE